MIYTDSFVELRGQWRNFIRITTKINSNIRWGEFHANLRVRELQIGERTQLSIAAK